MGLLDRSNVHQNKDKSPGKKSQKSTAEEKIIIPQEKINIIRDRIDNLNDGIDSPFCIFNILYDNINIDKGVMLFLIKQNDIFVSATSININNYSLKSLELQRNRYIELLQNDEIKFFNSKKELKYFKRFFSKSDFIKIHNILLFPFYLENKLIALLLLCNTNNSDITLLKHIFKKNTENVISYRYFLLDDFVNINILNKYNSRSVLNNLDTSKIKIINLSFNNIIDNILDNNAFITSGIIRNDLYLLFSNFFRKVSNTFIADFNNINILLNYSGKNKIDINLIKHQTDIFLKEYYKEYEMEINIKEINFYS